MNLISLKIGCYKLEMLSVIPKVTTKGLKIYRRGRKEIKIVHYKISTKCRKGVMEELINKNHKKHSENS